MIYALRNLFKLTNPKQFNWGTCLAINTKSQKQLMRIGKCDCLKKKGKNKKNQTKKIEICIFFKMCFEIGVTKQILYVIV